HRRMRGGSRRRLLSGRGHPGSGGKPNVFFTFGLGAFGVAGGVISFRAGGAAGAAAGVVRWGGLVGSDAWFGLGGGGGVSISTGGGAALTGVPVGVGAVHASGVANTCGWAAGAVERTISRARATEPTTAMPSTTKVQRLRGARAFST